MPIELLLILVMLTLLVGLPEALVWLDMALWNLETTAQLVAVKLLIGLILI